MKNTLSLSDFRQAWATSERANSFSYEALELLYDYYEECDPDMELDIIAIDCEWLEDDILSIAESHSIFDYIEVETELTVEKGELISSIVDIDQVKIDIINVLQEHTTILSLSNDNNTLLIVAY